MWPFGRTRDKASSAPRAVPAPVIRHDWAALPPIQRTVGDHPLTAPSERFRDDLATHHDPSVSSDQMGHQVTAEAPAGIVLTVARTAGTRSDGPAMIPRPHVQRRAEGAVAELGEADGEEAAADEPRPAPAPAAVQRVPVVERPVVAPISDQPRLTSLPPDAEPVPVAPARRSMPVAYREAPVQRQSDAPGPAVVEIAAPRLTLGQARRLGLGPPINRVPERGVQRSTTEAPTLPLRPPPPPPASEPRAVSEAALTPTPAPSPGIAAAAASALQRSSGESAVSSRPASQAESPAQTTPPMPPIDSAIHPLAPPPPSAAATRVRALPLGPIIQRATDASSAEGSTPDEPRDLPLLRASVAAPPGPSKTIIEPVIDAGTDRLGESRATDTPGESREPKTTSAFLNTPLTPAASPPTVSRMPSSSPMATLAPIIGSRPSPATIHLQRATQAGSGDVHVPAHAAVEWTGNGAPARERREGGATLTIPAMGPAGDPPPMAAEDHADPRAASVLPVWAGPDTAIPAVQRSSVFAGSRALALPSMAVASRRATGPDSSLGLASQGATGAAADLPLAPSMTAVVQRAIAVNASPAQEPDNASTPVFTAQREVIVSAAAEAAPAAATAAAATGGDSEPHSEQAMDELAGKLYDRIRARLRTELLVDRERAGFLTDLR